MTIVCYAGCDRVAPTRAAARAEGWRMNDQPPECPPEKHPNCGCPDDICPDCAASIDAACDVEDGAA